MKPQSQPLQRVCFDKADVFQDIFENANIGIFQTTPEGRYIRVNPALAEMYAYDDADHMLAALTDISHQLYIEPGRREEFQQTLLDEGEIENFESQVRRRDGKVIWISETARVIRCSPNCTNAREKCADYCDNQAMYYEGFVKDITQRRTLEAQVKAFTEELEERVERRTRELSLENERRRLAQSTLQDALNEAEHAVQAKAKFLANMSHELRTPLNAVIGFAQAIKAEIHGRMEPQAYGEYIGIIDNSARHLLELINDILDLSKIDSGTVDLDIRVTDICEVMGECLDLIGHRAQEAGVEIVREKPTDAGTVIQIDARRIKQVLLNLLSNAIKFTPSGGTVTVGVRESGDDGLIIEVRDSGVGIAPEDIAKVLSEYGQAEHGLDHLVEGTGLGLPISKKLVELHGGALNLASQPGQGTSVTFTLPRVCKAA